MTERRMPLPDIEWLAVEHRAKPGMRVTLPTEKLEAYANRLRKTGLSYALAARPAHLPGRSSQEVVYVAWTAAEAEALRAAEADILPGGPARAPDEATFTAHRRLGELLGFPACCVEAFVQRLARGVTRRAGGGEANEDFVAAEEALARSEKRDPRLNNLLFDRQLRLVSFYPCRFDCPSALDRAEAVRGAVTRASREAAAFLLTALAVRVILRPDGSRDTGDGPATDGALAIDFR